MFQPKCNILLSVNKTKMSSTNIWVTVALQFCAELAVVKMSFVLVFIPYKHVPYLVLGPKM